MRGKIVDILYDPYTPKEVYFMVWRGREFTATAYGPRYVVCGPGDSWWTDGEYVVHRDGRPSMRVTKREFERLIAPKSHRSKIPRRVKNYLRGDNLFWR